MDQVLSSEALADFNANGFVRPGLVLPAPLLEGIRENYAGMPSSLSNWSDFEGNVIKHKGDWRALKASVRVALQALKYRPRHERDSKKLYEKALFGSTGVLPVVLQACLDAGLSRSLGDVPLLVGHDLLLEASKHDANFGFHDDGFGWDVFFQTGDDLTVYVALQDMNAKTGGRLRVERSPQQSVLFQDRNAYIQRFARFCRDQGAVDDRGRVTREAAEECRRRNVIAEEFERLSRERAIRIRSLYRKVEMSQIEMVEGEVILFNNKLFHDVEPWKLDTFRSAYIIRCFPLYDMGLYPPSYFLNHVECNRFVLESRHGSLRPIDVSQEVPPQVPCPS